MSHAADSSFDPPRNGKFNAGHASRISFAFSSALSLEREPMTTLYPMEESRAARAVPAGPVPPNTPTLVCSKDIRSALHTKRTDENFEVHLFENG
jgi:hypothetical protein